jgi:hypothetical protein
LAFGKLFVDRDLDGMTLAQALRSGLWKEVLAVFAGGLFGMLVHPNFPNNFLFSWTQVFVIGLGTPIGKVVMGSEWFPADGVQLTTAYAPWIIAGLLGSIGIFLSPLKPFDRKKASLVLASGLLVAALFALTIKSRRTTEFLAPTVALWCGAMWSMVDAKQFFIQAWSSLAGFGRWGRRAIVFAVVVLSLGLAWREASGTWQALHPVGYPDAIYRKSLQAVSGIAQPGDRVFHSSWDEFPMLFAADDRLRYVSGLDPTFLYAASSTLSDDVKNLTWGMTSTTREQAWELIHDRLGSRFVFVSKRDVHRQFLDLVESDARYLKLEESEDSVVFEVSP